MDADDFNELSGRIEGMGRVLLLLLAEAEDKRVVDGHDFTRRIRAFAESLNFDRPHLEATKRTMLEKAFALDDARSYRQKQAGQAESPNREED